MRALVIALYVVMAAAAGAGAISSGCDDPPPLAPPLQHGVCEPAEYARGEVVAQRCEHGGHIWWCQGNVCTLALPVSRVPR